MKYVIRAAKYAVKLAFVLALFGLLLRWDWSAEPMRVRLFLGAVLLLCAFYPLMEFVRRDVFVGMDSGRGAIVKALEAGGFRVKCEDATSIRFVGQSLVRRICWLGEEAVTVTRNDLGGVTVEGPRRFVAEAQQRIPLYLNNAE